MHLCFYYAYGRFVNGLISFYVGDLILGDTHLLIFPEFHTIARSKLWEIGFKDTPSVISLVFSSKFLIYDFLFVSWLIANLLV